MSRPRASWGERLPLSAEEGVGVSTNFPVWASKDITSKAELQRLVTSSFMLRERLALAEKGRWVSGEIHRGVGVARAVALCGSAARMRLIGHHGDAEQGGALFGITLFGITR